MKFNKFKNCKFWVYIMYHIGNLGKFCNSELNDHKFWIKLYNWTGPFLWITRDLYLAETLNSFLEY